MASVLVLDWERTSFHAVAAELSRQGVELRAASVWKLEEELSGANADALGKKLREFLKAKGLPAAPVLACVGRDRVVLKEISYPAVSPQEEPALVRFQATKDLADSSEDVVLDYAPLFEPASSGERQALAVILRREILTSLQQLCRAAGVKLLGLVPRPFAMAGCLQLAQMRLAKLPGADGKRQDAEATFNEQHSAAVLLMGQRWAELNLLQGSKLVFSRSLGVGPSLGAEVRRSLTVFANQARESFPRPAPQVLYRIGVGRIANPSDGQDGGPDSLTGLDLPVHDLDFLTEQEKATLPAESRSALAASLGLVQSWSQKQVPINLASPREPPPVTDQRRRRRVLGGAVAALLLLGAWILGQIVLAGKKAEIQRMEEDKASVEANLGRVAQDRADLQALKEWEQGSIPWLDEFYDLAARFPRKTGFRLTKIQVEPVAKRNASERFAARMILHVVVPPGDEGQDLVQHFVDSMHDPHLQARVERLKDESFSIRVDVAWQKAGDYRTRLVVPGSFPRGSPAAKSPGENPELAAGASERAKAEPDASARQSEPRASATGTGGEP